MQRPEERRPDVAHRHRKVGLHRKLEKTNAPYATSWRKRDRPFQFAVQHISVGALKMLCEFCHYEFSDAVATSIEVIDGDCPSSCNDQVKIVLTCPNCKKVAWGKTIDQSYATHYDWPPGVKVVPWTYGVHQEGDSEHGTDEFSLVEDGGRLFLRRGEDLYVEVHLA